MKNRAARVIRLETKGPISPPPDRGKLLMADEVAAIIGGVSPKWVLRKMPHAVRVGYRIVRWYERDVANWLEENRTN